jgi:tRNA nucleotidyltransferase (CCA-adding enzyme)
VWIVGGAVRDALLGRDPRDLDLVVEGDAAEVARRLGEEPLLHERFGTATANGVVNLAAARRERYEQPGALPEVELGAPIAEDLARRDFTVNAIAVRLADGELQAAPGALEDVAGRRLRVLHDGSFLDDPTRLLRLVRYAARLRFQIEQATRELAFAAVEGNALATVTPSRLGNELRLLLEEPQPAAMCGLEAFGIGPRMLPGFNVDPDLVERAQRLTPADGRPDLVALAATCLDASAPDLAGRLDACEFPARERDTVTAAATRARHLAPVLGGMEDASAIWALLRREQPETVALAGALGAPEQAKRLARRPPPREARDHRRRPAGRRPRRARDRPRARRRHGGDARRSDRPRGAAGGGAGGPATMSAWTCPHPSTGATSTSTPPCPAARCCSRPAAAASPRARSPRSTSAG